MAMNKFIQPFVGADLSRPAPIYRPSSPFALSRREKRAPTMTTIPPYHLLPDTSTISPDGVLHIANHSIPALAQQFGTPLYIFDRQTIVNACQRYLQAFANHYHASSVRVLYASKAYLSPLIARLMSEQGLGLDVVSGGELLVAQRAEVPMEHIFFHGNNKSEDELHLALKLGVGRIVLDNWSELDRLHRLAHIAQQSGQKPAVLLRVAPAGAYCLPMSSNYNLVPRPAVILIDEENILLMERRETHQDLLSRYEQNRI